MATLNVARSKNPSARGMIKNKAANLSIIFDLPSAIHLSNQSSYMNYDLLSSGLGIAGQLAGGGIMLAAGTKQVWLKTAPTTFALQIMLDAETNGYEEVHRISNLLHQLTLPWEGPGGTLLPPNPIRLTNDQNITSVRLGRQYFFPTVVVNSVNSNSETRLDKDGYPISGTVDVTFTTDFVLSREEWAKIYGGSDTAGGIVQLQTADDNTASRFR